MLIGELARVTRTTTRMLRLYEERGLLPAARAANGYRTYDENAVVRVANIRYLLDAGLTLEDVAHFRACLDGDLEHRKCLPAANPLVEVGRRRLAVLDERIAGLVRARDHLADRLAQAGVSAE